MDIIPEDSSSVSSQANVEVKKNSKRKVSQVESPQGEPVSDPNLDSFKSGSDDLSSQSDFKFQSKRLESSLSCNPSSLDPNFESSFNSDLMDLSLSSLSFESNHEDTQSDSTVQLESHFVSKPRPAFDQTRLTSLSTSFIDLNQPSGPSDARPTSTQLSFMNDPYDLNHPGPSYSFPSLVQPKALSIATPTFFQPPPMNNPTIDLTNVNPLLGEISDFCDRDLLYRMSESECELLWMLREDCKRSLPNALNKLMLSFKWNQQKYISPTLALLQSWPKIAPHKALELLDYAYPDPAVRKYAIMCLKGLWGFFNCINYSQLPVLPPLLSCDFTIFFSSKGPLRIAPKNCP